MTLFLFLTIYFIGAVLAALLIRKSFIHAYTNGRYCGTWKPSAVYVAMIVLWPFTLIFLLYAQYMASALSKS